MYKKIAFALVVLFVQITAYATTYTYTGLNYNFVAGTYTTSMHMSGSFTTSSPLVGNMGLTDIGPLGTNIVTAWSFNDGINTFTQANSVPMPPAGATFRVGTDASGNINAFNIQLESPLPPHSVAQLLNVITLSTTGQQGQSQGLSSTCLTLSGNVCATFNQATQYGDSPNSGSFAPTVTATPPSITKAFGALSIAQNGTTGLTFNITNPNAATALSGVTFTDTLPAGMIVATPSGLSSTCTGTATAVAASGSVSLSAGSIPANSSCAIAVTVQATTTGTKNNSVLVTSTEGGTGNTSNASLNVLAASAPSIAKAFGSGSIAPNGTTSLTFTITNPNAALALTGIAFTDTLPAGMVVATPNGLSSTCGGTATAVAGSGSVSLSAGSVAANSSCTVAVTVQGTSLGAKNNSVSVTSTEGGAGNTSSASLSVLLPSNLTSVPTLSQWGLALSILSILMAAGLLWRHKRAAR